MSSQVWKRIHETIRSVNRSIPNHQRRSPYADSLIVSIYLWSVMHDRPMCWAVDRASYNAMFRPKRLPSRSQFCRRIKSARCQQILHEVHKRLSGADQDDEAGVRFMDGRIFRVSPSTTDPDARSGYGGGAFSRGYRLHAMCTFAGKFTHFRVTSMNVGEKKIARELVDDAKPRGVVLADGGYESGPLMDFVMDRGALMITPLKKNAGSGHRPQSRTRMIVKKLWDMGVTLLYAKRRMIERYFGQLSSFGGGLAPLPAWVRRLDRVTRWITAKIIIYHARLAVKSNQT